MILLWTMLLGMLYHFPSNLESDFYITENQINYTWWKYSFHVIEDMHIHTGHTTASSEPHTSFFTCKNKMNDQISPWGHSVPLGGDRGPAGLGPTGVVSPHRSLLEQNWWKITSTMRCCYLCNNLSLDPACKKTLWHQLLCWHEAVMLSSSRTVKQSMSSQW